MTKEQKKINEILNQIAQLGLEKMNEKGPAGEHDKLEKFSAMAEYGKISASFEIVYSTD